MIYGKLCDSDAYCGVHPLLKPAFDAIKKFLAENPAPGHYEVDGKNLFANINAYDTIPRSERKYENHHAYIDILVMLKGAELIDVICTPEEYPGQAEAPFSTEKDCELYAPTPVRSTLEVRDDRFLLLFPNELHAPGIQVGDTGDAVCKIVFKILY